MSTIGFIGGGNMGLALARCLQGAGLAEGIAVYDTAAERCALFSRELSGVTVAADAGAVCRAADATFLAVKPQDVDAATAALGGCASLIVSIVAGVSLARLAERLPGRAAGAGHAQHPVLGGSNGGGVCHIACTATRWPEVRANLDRVADALSANTGANALAVA